MIAIEIRISPSVWDCSGEGLSVQLTKSARRSEKSHRLVVQSSSWKSVSVTSSSFSRVSRTLARVERLLSDWFAREGRDLPWRRTRDPYAILVSEVMLQQTQVERVVPRYLAWLERWPTVEALAAASAGDVIREWQGLGYNRRALNLHRSARQIAAAGWPPDLTELPGVGEYTAAAIRRFAFDEDVLPVDVNVERVLRRTGFPFSGRAAQALMDLGATVCLARIPRCAVCPLATVCPSRGVRDEPAAQARAVRGIVSPAPSGGAAIRGERRAATGAARRRGSPLARERRPRRRRERPRRSPGLEHRTVDDDRHRPDRHVTGSLGTRDGSRRTQDLCLGPVLPGHHAHSPQRRVVAPSRHGVDDVALSSGPFVNAQIGAVLFPDASFTGPKSRYETTSPR